MARIEQVRQGNVIPLPRSKRSRNWLHILLLINIILSIGLYIIALSK